MYWLKLGGFLLPLFGYVGVVYGSLVPLPAQFKILIAGAGFLLGGLAASVLYELEQWFSTLSDAYGSASFATVHHIKKAGLFSPKGILLGKYNGRPIRLDQPGHMLTIAPTRSGKGTSAVIPNLLDYPGSVVTVDIKGENFAIAGRRRRDFGMVFRLAPFETESHCFNPFDFIRGGEHAWDDAALLADMLIVPSGSAKSVFFEQEAKALLTGLVLYVATEAPPESRNLARVRELITLGGDAFFEMLANMSKAEHPLVRRIADSFGQKDPKLQSSVLSEAQSHTLIFDSERVKRITSRSDFSFEELKERPISLFLIVPPEHLGVYRPLIRLFLGLAVSAMTRKITPAVQDVLFLVDEFPALGRMGPLEEGIAYLAGYGVKLWLFAQDLGQLESVYGRNATRSIIANSNLQTFSNMDNETLEMVSRMLGTGTVRVRHRSKSRHSLLLPDYDHFNVSAGETGRPLLTPDEIRCLGDDRELLFLKGIKPVLAEKVPYYEERRFRGLWDKWRQ